MEMLYTKTEQGTIRFKKDKLNVEIFPSRIEMGKKVAADVSMKIKELLTQKDEVNIIFAAAPSQEELLQFLVADSDIDWSSVNAFHMDEYIGLSPDAPQGFGNFLRERIFDRVPFRSVNYLNGQALDATKECNRYAALLQEYKVDIVCLGIGENGHIAFNDPVVADFNDPLAVKVVELDIMCRQQQVNENCFTDFALVPTHAFTVTIPSLMKADYMFCTVPAINKANAVKMTLSDSVSELCPATILRTKENVKLYLDDKSSSLIQF